MVERRITHTYKDQSGAITHVSNPGEWWSPQTVALTCSHIWSRDVSYYVDAAGWRAQVDAVRGPSGPYLRTYADETSMNNLENLPVL